MNDVRDELVQALQLRLNSLNGAKIHFEICDCHSSNDQLGDDFIVNHVARVFDTMNFDRLVQFFEQEAVQYLQHLHNSGIIVSDLLFLFREVPASDQRNKIRYISIVRKKS